MSRWSWPDDLSFASPNLVGIPTQRSSDLFINYFRKDKKLGKGGFGETFKVSVLPALEQISPYFKAGEVYTLKLLNNVQDTMAVASEIEILRRLSLNTCQPNIVCYVGYITYPKERKVMILTEFIEGTGLKKHCEEEKCTTDDILSLVSQLILGLKFLHDNNIVHRDIKPDNILVTKDYKIVKYIDFGTSCYIENAGDELLLCDYEKVQMGTTAFLSPEIIDLLRVSPKGDISEIFKPADIWALGLTIYELIFGKQHPATKNIYNIPNEDFTIRELPSGDYPPSLLPMLNRMLEKDYTQRITIDECYKIIFQT